MALVGRPPVAGAAIHLFLGDELRHAVLDRAAPILGQRLVGPGGEIVHMQILVADVGHIAAVRRDRRVGREAVGAGGDLESARARAVWRDRSNRAGHRAETAAPARKARRNIPGFRRAPRFAGARGGPISSAESFASPAPAPSNRPGAAPACRGGCIPTGRAGPCRRACLAGRSPARRPGDICRPVIEGPASAGASNSRSMVSSAAVSAACGGGGTGDQGGRQIAPGVSGIRP